NRRAPAPTPCPRTSASSSNRVCRTTCSTSWSHACRPSTRSVSTRAPPNRRSLPTDGAMSELSAHIAKVASGKALSFEEARAAFVIAGCGVPVAKHGNRGLSSQTGAADVLTALGIKIDLTPDAIGRSIREAGVGFMFAPAHHPAMRHVGPTRIELGTRTIFNLLGPLSNPARVKRQMVGVFSRQWVEPIAHVLKNLGSERAIVVHGSDGLDEITTAGPTRIASFENGTVRAFDVSPEDFGLPKVRPDALRGGDAKENAAALLDVLQG